MIESEKQMTATDRKEKIRSRYKGIDPSELEVIPAKPVDEVSLAERPLKVAAYVRVSTENDEQTSSYELQINDFTERIKANPNWEFVGIYSDEGISGTELSHRKGMLQMIEDAKAGKIEHILAKSIARFARNVVDCLSIIEELRKINVGVHFDENNLYTLDTTGALVLTILATVAEEESRSKSFIMNWSIERRFSKGIFLLQELLGYDKDEDGNLIINASEAETVKVIYDLYLNGWSYSEIADKLTSYGRKTKLGNTKWNPTSISGIIENERYCGDVLARKTYTPDFKTHKSKKNENNRNQYKKKNHHDSIVPREVYDAARRMQAYMRFTKGKRALPVLSVVDEGVLKGYVPIHKDWTGFSGDEYRAASESVKPDKKRSPQQNKKVIDLSGYQRVSASLFSSSDKPVLTITNGRMRFNAACVKKFQNVEYVELLLNSVNNRIAIRPCDKDNPNAIRWARLKNEKWVAYPLACKGLFGALVDIVNWSDDSIYKLYGQFIENGKQKMLLFSLDEPDITKTQEQVVVPDKPDEDLDCETEQSDNSKDEIVVIEKVRVFPDVWDGSFGMSVPSIVSGVALKRVHYSGDWDVLRPAKEIEGMNFITTEQLQDLMSEAEQIMEGWAINEAS